jgi:hypothetical protein
MIRFKKILFLTPLFLLIFVFATEAKRRKPKKVKPKPEPEIIVQTDSTGMPIRKKRTPDEIFNALHSVLRAMTEDMDEFNFNKIHPHLKIVYALYNELRLLATDDSLLNNSGIPDTLINAKTINFNQSSNKDITISDTSSSTADSTLVITIDSTKSDAISALQITQIKPVINETTIDPTKLLKDKLVGNQPTSFSLSWDDTSFQKYLIKFEIVKDSTGVGFVWNVVFEKVDKLKNKTVKVHKYFDVGEFSISAQDLVWLCDAVKRTETEVLNYFYAKDKEKKESQQ